MRQIVVYELLVPFLFEDSVKSISNTWANRKFSWWGMAKFLRKNWFAFRAVGSNTIKDIIESIIDALIEVVQIKVVRRIIVIFENFSLKLINKL